MHDSPNGEVVSSNYLYKAEMLAYAIPSESYAVGANSLAIIGVSNENMAEYDEAGKAGLVGDDRKWLHSTFMQRSLKRVHRLFESIVGTINNGGSNE